MPIDALTLGIGLQGRHDFNLDGLKYQLEQQQAKAKADAKANKDAWDSYSDPLKDAMATMDASKIKPYLQQKAKTQFADTISKINERRKNGSTYGAKDIEDIQNLTFNLQKMYQESKGWDQVVNLHPKVVENINNPDGIDWLISQGPYYGTDVSPYQDGGYSISGSGMVDYDAIAKSKYEGIAEADLIEAIGKPTSRTVGDKIVQEQVYGLPSDVASVREDQLVSEILNTPGALLKFFTDNGLDGTSEKYFTDGPGGVGVMPKPEIMNMLRDYAKSVTGRYVKKGTLSDQPSGTGETPFQKSMSVSDVSSDPNHLSKGHSFRQVTYVPKKNLPPRSVDITKDVLKVDEVSGESLVAVEPDKIGKPLRDVQKSNMRVGWRDGKGYFIYGSDDNTYFVPLSQKSFTEFVQNTGDSPESVRENLVKVATGDDLSLVSSFVEFVGEEYNPAVAEKNKKNQAPSSIARNPEPAQEEEKKNKWESAKRK